MSNKEKTFVVYKHTCIITNKSYIGITYNYEKRCRQHQYKSNECRLFSIAIKKYKWSSFIHEILATGLTIHAANHFEQFYIKHFNSVAPSGYNLRSGGDNSLHNEETKQKIRKSNSGENHPMFGRRGEYHHWFGKFGEESAAFGRKHTIDAIEKLKIAKSGKNHPNFGKKLSKETCIKIGEAQKGEKHHMFGKKHSQETIEKLKIAFSGKNNPQYGKTGDLSPNFGKSGNNNHLSKTYKITCHDGVIEIITGLRHYCKLHGLDQSAMNSIAKGKYKQHKGFICEYYNEQI